MRWLKPGIALLLLAFWAPATAHCELERVPALQFLACHTESDSQSHSDADCDGDGCKTVESGSYVNQDDPPGAAPVASAPSPAWAAAADGVLLSIPNPQDLGRALAPARSPTRLCLLRTARLPRAPSPTA